MSRTAETFLIGLIAGIVIGVCAKGGTVNLNTTTTNRTHRTKSETQVEQFNYWYERIQRKGHTIFNLGSFPLLFILENRVSVSFKGNDRYIIFQIDLFNSIVLMCTQANDIVVIENNRRQSICYTRWNTKDPILSILNTYNLTV